MLCAGPLTGISYGGTLRHEYSYSAAANDGREASYKNWQSGEDVQYTYDSLARLTKTETLGPDWGQGFGYDGWGNLLSKSVTKGSAPVMSVTADAATNRLVVSGMAYDANGNVTNMRGVGTIAYDARNRITGTGGVPTRGYDPGNRKIWWKDSNGITFVDYWLPNGEKLVTYKIDEAPYVNDQRYPGPVQFLTVTRTLYFAGRQVKVEGRYGVGGYVEWPQPDRLSSTAPLYPYGEERSTSSTEYKFATYQREASGLDYALNRYYSSVYGRFLSSDPYRASGGPSDPGSWNRYAYVQGDPVNFNDPPGLLASSADRSDTVSVSGGTWELESFVQAVLAGRTLSQTAQFLAAMEDQDFSDGFAMSYGGSPGAVAISMSPSVYNSFVAAGAIVLPTGGVTIGGVLIGILSSPAVITVASVAAAGYVAYLAYQNYHKLFPTVEDLRSRCNPIGPPVIVPSTRRGNRDGGQSIEQEYECTDGSRWTIHTVVDGAGRVVLAPHVRPGSPKY